MCEQLAQGHYLTKEWLELNLQPLESQAKCCNRYTTRPHSGQMDLYAADETDHYALVLVLVFVAFS